MTDSQERTGELRSAEEVTSDTSTSAPHWSWSPGHRMIHWIIIHHNSIQPTVTCGLLAYDLLASHSHFILNDELSYLTNCIAYYSYECVLWPKTFLPLAQILKQQFIKLSLLFNEVLISLKPMHWVLTLTEI